MLLKREYYNAKQNAARKIAEKFIDSFDEMGELAFVWSFQLIEQTEKSSPR